MPQYPVVEVNPVLECVGGSLDGDLYTEGSLNKKKFKSGSYVRGLWGSGKDEVDIWLWVPLD